MASLDIFNDDAFSLSSLSQTIIDIPDIPTKLGAKGIFNEYGLTGTSFWIERKGGKVTLVPTSPRGTRGEPVALGKRKMISLATFHIQKEWSVLADEVLNARAFGKESELETVQSIVQQKLAAVRADIDLTHEYHRVGALKGVVKDADGSTLVNLFDTFDMTQETAFFDIATPSTSVKAKDKIIALKRIMQRKLGGRSFSGIRVIASEGFFDKLIGHQSVEKAYERWQEGAFFRQDQSETDFEFIPKVRFEVYSGGTDAGDFIEDGIAYAYPEGVPGLFQTAYAPADYMETVGTMGQAFYAKQELMPMGRGVQGEAQSNPLHYCTLPETLIKLSVAAS